MSAIEDRLLINTFLLTRSEAVFKQIYRKHSLHLYRMALLLVNKDLQTAEDLLQETWIRAVENLQKFKWNSSLRTWLCGILINCNREQNRKKQLYPTAENVNHIQSLAHDAKIDLQNALALLPHGYREILILHDIEGWKHTEISQLLGISEGTSKSQLFHARKSIRSILN